MSKPTKSIGAWLSGVFGKSFKTISEKLTPEELSEFSAEASVLMDAEDADDDDQDEDDDQDDEEEDKKKKKKKKSGDAENSDESGTVSFEERLTALENNLQLKDAENLSLKNQLEIVSASLKKAQGINAKLRQSINPLADKDQASGSEVKQVLTQTDIEARAAFAAATAED